MTSNPECKLVEIDLRAVRSGVSRAILELESSIRVHWRSFAVDLSSYPGVLLPENVEQEKNAINADNASRWPLLTGNCLLDAARFREHSFPITFMGGDFRPVSTGGKALYLGR